MAVLEKIVAFQLTERFNGRIWFANYTRGEKMRKNHFI